MPGQGRLGDKANAPIDTHGCPACPHPSIGPAIRGSLDVSVNRRPALRVDDPGIHAACCGPNTWAATTGSQTVFINGKSAHRVGDQNRHCGGMGRLVEGSPNVIVGDAGGGGVVAASTQAARHGAPGARGVGGTGGSTTPLTRPASNAAGGLEPVDAGVRPLESSKLTFVELKLIDADGQPVPFARYRVTSADGAMFSGTLDARGRARVDGLSEGTCQVTFPEFHGDDWGPA